MTNPSGDVPRTSGRHGRGIGWGVAAAVAVLLLVAAPAAAGAPSSGAERSRDTTAEGGALPAAAAAAFLQDDDAVIVAAIEVSEQRFPDGEPGPGVPTAGWAVLSRTGVFADSLTGSALTVSGPLLFTPSDSLDPRTLAELERVLDDGDRIYLLGGEAALSAGIEETLQDAGFATVRLAGPSRVETAAAIAERMLDIGGSGRVLIARADGPADNPTAAWADSVTAGAWAADQAVPILLTQTDSLHPAVHTHLDRYRPETVVLLGGEAALSAAVAAEIPGVQRIAGPNRFATAVAVADELWTTTSGEYLVTSGTAVDGWAYGLAAAGLGGQTDRPLLLVETDRLPAEIDAALCATGTRAPVTVIGGLDVVSQQVRDAMTAPC